MMARQLARREKTVSRLIASTIVMITLLLTTGATAGEYGACCLPDDSCIDLPVDVPFDGQVICETALQGIWLGDGTSCKTNSCQSGACCFMDIECEDFWSQQDCESAGGVFLGELSMCENEGSYCRDDLGACCVEYEICYDLISQDECSSMGGEFFGIDSTCNEDAPWCIILFGACCFGEYCLELVEEDECELSGGTFWYGPCDEFTDVPECVASPRGACCVNDINCETDVTELECDQMNGLYYGDDSTECHPTCAVNVYGACCLDDGCSYMPDFLCLVSEGTFLPGEYCSPDPCQTCDGDLNGDGNINVNDLLALLAAFGQNDAGDCDGDGDTDVNDVLFLINAWGDCP